MNIYIVQVTTGDGSITMLLVLIRGVDVNQFIEVMGREFTNNKREANFSKVR